ncbi:O-antigen polysaccharide polymerase Wzy family protein [Aeribacillus sp. FSL K6-8210]|uniref:O-antigen polysaccharide polymerase Wzy family protein n=1 Tax=Aeribacillus sp. FSL K6-8210 TaxID=2954683 RepID=UPI0030D167DB
MLVLLRNVFLLISILLFFIGIIADSINIINFSIFLLLIQNIWFAFEKFSERVIFFSFNITLFVFILSRPFIITLFDYQHSEAGFFGTEIYDPRVIINIFIGIYISMLFLFLGNLLMEKRILNKKVSENILEKTYNKSLFWIYFKNISKYFFYFLLIFRFLYLKDQTSFVQESGYFDFYTSYKSNLPPIVVKLSEMYAVPFFAFLSVKPTKKEAILPILLYLIEGVISLGTGKRAGFILNIIIILIYFAFRDKDSKKKWLGKKEIITTITAIPIVATLMNIVSYTRVGMTEATSNVNNMVLEFFYKQGVTLKTLAYSQEFKVVYPDHQMYSLGTIIEFLKSNIITQLFFDFPVYSGQSIERALNGNLFSHRISYYIMPSGYLQGRGYGSSYIAELNVDFGIIGVAIGSFLFGLLFVVLYKWFFNGKPYISTFALLLIRNLMMTPRSETTAFITSSFTLINILGVVILLFSSYLFINLFNKSQFIIINNRLEMEKRYERN